MAGAAGPISAISSLASAGLKVAGDLGSAGASKTQGQIAAMRSQTAAKAADARADETNASYFESLEAGRANFEAIRASQNVGIDSATSLALLQHGEDLNDYQRQIAVSNQRLQAITARGDAKLAQTAASNATMASYLKAGVDSVGVAQSIYSGGQQQKWW